MSIDALGKWWKGTSPDDIQGFLEAYASEGYEVQILNWQNVIVAQIHSSFFPTMTKE